MHRAKLLLLFVCFFVSNLLTWMVFRHFEKTKYKGITKQVPKFSAVIYSFGSKYDIASFAQVWGLSCGYSLL